MEFSREQAIKLLIDYLSSLDEKEIVIEDAEKHHWGWVLEARSVDRVGRSDVWRYAVDRISSEVLGFGTYGLPVVLRNLMDLRIYRGLITHDVELAMKDRP